MSTYFTSAFIDGHWRDDPTAQRFAVRDPADDTVIADYQATSLEECAHAVDAAERALAAWSATTPRARAEVLRATFEILRADADSVARAIVRENGKSWADAHGEARYAADFFRWFAEEAVRICGDYRLSPSGDKRIIVDRQPIGVSVLVTPWNFPAAMAARKLAPALAAGCTAVLKPARETPLTAGLIVDALHRAGAPAGVVNLVMPIPAREAVRVMLAHQAVRKLSFTGSTEVGRELLHASADRVISTSMELGGNAPLVVLEGADVEIAVEGALQAKMRNGGCACTAANRFYVHRSVLEPFTTAFGERLAGLRVGPGSDRTNDVGSMVSTTERDKVDRIVSAALAAGAEIAFRGDIPADGAFSAPLVLSGVDQDNPITSQEIFGPVAPVIAYDDLDDAVRMANDSIHGLVAYVFGEEGVATRVARRIDTGMVAVNRGVLSDPAAPFGGVKQSGLGREGGFDGIHEFLEEKYIAVPA